ncbi:hypothetical protein Tco_0294162 [Tanacetum coccineum]
MDLKTAQTNTTVKLPLLKQGEYDMWKLRIEQYVQVQDYALWDVIENGIRLRMTKVIRGEFKKIKDVKVKDVFASLVAIPAT